MKQPFGFTFFLLICIALPLTATAQVDDIIPDPNLRAVIEESLGYPRGAPITEEEIEDQFTRLEARNTNITDLTGLEHAKNLTFLNLESNNISDISPLAELTKLTTLSLGGNNIANISPLAGLTHLTFLSLGGNNIIDISPVAGLTNLTRLELNNTAISDISPLEHLTNLISLFLQNNTISDISPVAALTNLTSLRLWNNTISDISPVAALTNLTYLALSSNTISDISPLAALTNLEWLYLYNNNISDLSPLVANAGLGSGDEIEVRENPLSSLSINTHIPKLQDRGVTVEFDVPLEEPVNIPDANLRTAIEKNLGKAPGTAITPADMANLTELWAEPEPSAEDDKISDLTGLEHAKNLTFLNLQSNNISDISPLAELTKLETLRLGYNNIADISPLAGLTSLTILELGSNNITDILPLVGLTNLTFLSLGGNNITDISPLEHLTNLTGLQLWRNNITDISPLEHLTNLTRLYLSANNITDILPLVNNTGLGSEDEVLLNNNPLSSVSIQIHLQNLQARGVTVEFDVPLEEPVNIPDANLRAAIAAALDKASDATITTVDMAQLTHLDARNANISDLTGLEDATNLTWVHLGDTHVEGKGWINSNSIKDLSPLAELNNLTSLNFSQNNISDLSPLAELNNLTWLDVGGNNLSNISPVAELINLTALRLWRNNIVDISPVADLIDLTELNLDGNNVADLSPLAELTNLTKLRLGHNSISDLSSLVTNTGLGRGDTVYVGGNPLSYPSIKTHIPILRSRGVEVHADNLKATTLEYHLSVPADYSLIHVPLRVTEVDGIAQTITSVGDLYDALGGENTVKLLLTVDSQTQEWFVYLNPSNRGTSADRALTDDMGIIVEMEAPKLVRLTGNPLGKNGTSTITLNPGYNILGVPLKDSRLTHVSDLFTLEGIGGNAPVVIFTDNADVKAVTPAGGPDDIEITGEQAFFLEAQRAAKVDISGEGWTNVSGTVAAPPVAMGGIKVDGVTPILALRGSIVDEGTGVNKAGFRVTVKNLSTGKAVATTIGGDEMGYRLAVVDIETMRAATVGDTLEISAQTPDPFIGVQPLQYTVTAEDVKRRLIQLPELVAYEIPAETQLLANYPNPFNPETWIPYRLAEDAFVTLTIYDGSGHVVRTLDIGHRRAAAYESRSKAIYWDGRNEVGEQVASGLYFYYLSAGDYSATRRMLILK